MGINISWYNAKREKIADTLYPMDEGEYVAIPEAADTFTFFHVDTPPITGTGNITLPPRSAIGD